MDIEVSPEIAAIVIEKYLLPMFEADNQSIVNRKRMKELGKSSKEKINCKTDCNLPTFDKQEKLFYQTIN